MRNLFIVTPFRNAYRNIDRFFKQVYDLSALVMDDFNLSLICLEGDSTDNTQTKLEKWQEVSPFTVHIVDVSHGNPVAWKSVEDHERLVQMSKIMNKGLDYVCDLGLSNDDVYIWIMSDLEWNAREMKEAIDHLCSCYHCALFAPLVMIGDSDLFYDTWAFRGLDGERFSNRYPYHNDLVDKSIIDPEIASAGSCLIMLGRVILQGARATDNEAVSFCDHALIGNGFTICLNRNIIVRHKNAPLPRLLLIGEAIIPTGFSRATHALLPELSSYFDITIIGSNYKGQPHNLPYPVYPAQLYGGGYAGEETACYIVYQNEINRTRFDVILIQGDVWNCSKAVQRLESLAQETELTLPKIILWCTVDGLNYDFDYTKSKLDDGTVDRVIVLNQFGKDQFTLGIDDPKVMIIPLGVDLVKFSPRDKVQCRAEVFKDQRDLVKDETFIVGYVGRNTYRKRIDLLLRAYSEWTKDLYNVDSILYLHIPGSDRDGGINIEHMVKYYDLSGKVLINRTVLPDFALRDVYNSLDVLVDPCMAGAWELPVLEAMACGVPVIVPDFGGIGSWTKDCEGALKVQMSDLIPIAPMNAGAYVLGGIIDTRVLVNYFWHLYDNGLNVRLNISKLVRDFSLQFSWSSMSSSICSLLNESLSRITS